MTNKDDLIKAFETISSFCGKSCTHCPLKRACEHYFDYGSLRGFTSTAVRLLK